MCVFGYVVMWLAVAVLPILAHMSSLLSLCPVTELSDVYDGTMTVNIYNPSDGDMTIRLDVEQKSKPKETMPYYIGEHNEKRITVDFGEQSKISLYRASFGAAPAEVWTLCYEHILSPGDFPPRYTGVPDLAEFTVISNPHWSELVRLEWDHDPVWLITMALATHAEIPILSKALAQTWNDLACLFPTGSRDWTAGGFGRASGLFFYELTNIPRVEATVSWRDNGGEMTTTLDLTARWSQEKEPMHETVLFTDKDDGDEHRRLVAEIRGCPLVNIPGGYNEDEQGVAVFNIVNPTNDDMILWLDDVTLSPLLQTSRIHVLAHSTHQGSKRASGYTKFNLYRERPYFEKVLCAAFVFSSDSGWVVPVPLNWFAQEDGKFKIS